MTLRVTSTVRQPGLSVLLPNQPRQAFDVGAPPKHPGVFHKRNLFEGFRGHQHVQAIAIEAVPAVRCSLGPPDEGNPRPACRHRRSKVCSKGYRLKIKPLKPQDRHLFGRRKKPLGLGNQGDARVACPRSKSVLPTPKRSWDLRPRCS